MGVMMMKSCVVPLCCLLGWMSLAAAPPEAKRVVVLGDSITHSGQYLEYLETILLVQTEKRYELLNLGLSSETVSGLSEPGHADGKFPRPGLHERLQRVLDKAKPDLVLACYGMNDGIYFPLKQSRFDRFIEGIEQLRSKVKAAGAALIHLTPPVFDPLPIKDKVMPAGLNAYPRPFEGYNRVLDRYSEWLLSKKSAGWEVIDVHGPMNAALAEQRKADAGYSFSKDGVHPGKEGHWIISQSILDAWGVKHDWVLEDLVEPKGRLAALNQLVAERQRVLKAAWVEACGHKRPGVGKGLPLEEAKTKAAEISQAITALLESNHGFAKSAAAGEDKTAPPMTKKDGESKPQEAVAKPGLFPGTLSMWHGFDRYDFDWQGIKATVVAPKEAAAGKPWVWHGEFFGHKPDPDVALLEKGFHIVYLKMNDTLGCPATVKTWTDFYQHLTQQYRFSKKPSLVGLSRGGLYCYNWAIANPGKVSCIYADAPVCDFKSWPGGKGKGPGDPRNWALVLKLWEFKDESEALAYKGNPVDALAPLAKNKVPLLHVFGDADEVVPAEENTLLLAERYRGLGGTIELIAKAGGKHHPHGLQDSTPIVNFILRHAK
jgi:lysophospholipase L1-like esterase/pimeloyl-ACP methyl ester carboxylesterase